MLLKLRQRMAQDESGFTLVELLVVMLILGLLAAIAIPAFFNQRDKARDAEAKAAVRTAETAIETYATDNDGSYAGATSDPTAVRDCTCRRSSRRSSDVGDPTDAPGCSDRQTPTRCRSSRRSVATQLFRIARAVERHHDQHL